MNNDISKKNFLELINDCKKIRIPKIQRDYAQGRLDDKVNEIRKHFVHALMRVVKGQVYEQELDFVYGSDKNNAESDGDFTQAFEPLDGQQRLTTLFLLHWMMGTNLCTPDGKHSVLTYETRPTSKDFCDALVGHEAKTYIEECRVSAKKKPSDVIKEKDWYQWGWKFDPTIQSMLVVIDAIYEEMPIGIDYEACRKRLDNVSFKILKLEDLNASDELFVKMNARGKHLSDFDLLKSTLEEELQLQQSEGLANKDIEKVWRTLMDGAWIDMFWNKYARNIIEKQNNLLQEAIQTQQDLFDNSQFEKLQSRAEEEKKKAAQEAEIKFRRMLVRLIALQLFANEKLPEELRDVCYHVNEKDLDAIIYGYQDYTLQHRHPDDQQERKDNFVRIDFKSLIDDVNHLVFKDSLGDYREITELLGNDFHAEIDNPEDKKASLMDEFLKEDRLGNDVELIFFAVLVYLRHYPLNQQEDYRIWNDNFKEWANIVRNVFLNVNRNQRIDKKDLMDSALKGIFVIVDKFVNYLKESSLNPYVHENAVRRFVANLAGFKRDEFPGIDNQCLSEEIEKAILKLDDNAWASVISNAEKHQYLWGQIRCLIKWADGDISSFEDYTRRLHSLLDYMEDHKYYLQDYHAAILAILPECWKNRKGRLYEFNKDRDNSVKRCLRDSGDNEPIMGYPQKILIDKWRNDYSGLEIEDVLKAIAKEKIQTSTGWQKCILLKPEILNYSWRKKLFLIDGHVVLAQLQTPDSHCYDPILKFIELFLGTDCFQFGDSKADDENSVGFTFDNKNYFIKWATVTGCYSLRIGNEPNQTVSEDEIVEFVLKLFSK